MVNRTTGRIDVCDDHDFWRDRPNRSDQHNARPDRTNRTNGCRRFRERNGCDRSHGCHGRDRSDRPVIVGRRTGLGLPHPEGEKWGYKAGMSCPLCHSKCKTTDSRGYWHEDVVRRRRACLSCGYKFTTHEQVVIRGDIVVTKRSGSREPFDMDKLKKSLAMALTKRNITPERIQRMAQSIGEALDFGDDIKHKSQKGEYRLVTSAYIGHLAMESLKALDPVGYVRYASIHRRFYSADDFQKLLDTME